jgi:hypothetical protein
MSSAFLMWALLAEPAIGADNLRRIRDQLASDYIRRAQEEAPKVPCAKKIENCPLTGCASHDATAEALANSLKRRIKGTPPASGTTISQLINLQEAVDSLLSPAGAEGHVLAAKARKKVSRVDLGGGATLGESSTVRLAGFVVGETHFNTGESVNCNLSGHLSNDVHATLASRVDSSPFEGVVIEFTPQTRRASWLGAFTKAQKADHPVLVVGPLFYDSFHVVNEDAKHSRPGQPPRASLWEVHPVLQVFVCSQKPCDPNISGQWQEAL